MRFLNLKLVLIVRRLSGFKFSFQWKFNIIYAWVPLGMLGLITPLSPANNFCLLAFARVWQPAGLRFPAIGESRTRPAIEEDGASEAILDAGDR